MQTARFPAILLLLSGCAMQSLPPPHAEGCGPLPSPAELWTCLGKPDGDHRESGFRSTMRLVYGDLHRRMSNQHASTSCDLEPRPHFDRLELPADAGRAPLRAYFHSGDPAKPIIFVVHGLFDSNADRYVRVVADALASDSFGVVVPDMRWHGCLLSNSWISTLGLEEARDLVAWASSVRSTVASNRRIGLIGFSMGGLDVINAMAQPEAVDTFDDGAIAISPPADLASVVRRFKTRPSLCRDRGSFIFRLAFRRFLDQRLRDLDGSESSAPFDAYLIYALVHWPASSPPGSLDELLADADPKNNLMRVRRPLLVVTSASDPVLGADSSVALEGAGAGLAYVEVIATRDGGHVGQIGRYPQWISNAIARFFAQAFEVPPAESTLTAEAFRELVQVHIE